MHHYLILTALQYQIAYALRYSILLWHFYDVPYEKSYDARRNHDTAEHGEKECIQQLYIEKNI